MMAATQIQFIDISVHNRHIRSIKEEQDFTAHSLGYLEFLHKNIHFQVIRFGNASEATSHFKLFRYNFQDALRLYRFFILKKDAVVLFHGFSFPFRLLLLKLFFGRKAKWIIQHHAGNPSPNFLKRKIQQWAYSKADAYMFVTKEQAKPFLEAGIIASKDKIWEIMECSTGFELKDKKLSRKTLLLPETKKIFIWVGNLDANKDPMCLMHAMQAYFQTHQNWLLYMFYNKTDLLEEVSEFVTKNKLDQNIILKGKLDNQQLEDWYNAADYFVSCSHSEGSGVALAESMACGCVPIVSDIPSFIYMTDDIGLRFKTGSHKDLALQLIKLEAMDVDSETLKSRNAFERLLSFEAIGKKTSELAETLAHP